MMMMEVVMKRVAVGQLVVNARTWYARIWGISHRKYLVVLIKYPQK
jgi:hypothetical protein